MREVVPDKVIYPTNPGIAPEPAIRVEIKLGRTVAPVIFDTMVLPIQPASMFGTETGETMMRDERGNPDAYDF